MGDGLGPDVIRAWERRFRAIEPARSAGNQRLYSEQQVERLVLLRCALDAGWQIGHVASLSDEALRGLLETFDAPKPRAEGTSAATSTAARLVDAAPRPVARLDEDGLERLLDEAAVELGRVEALDRVVVPVIHRVGDAYGSGALRIAHEHLATAGVARFLGRLQAAHPAAPGAPGIVVTTPAGQHHALGALLTAATARMEGWRTTYLGPNLPAEEIAAAARSRSARAVALSIVFPPGDPDVASELSRLGRMLQGGATIVAGGAASASYADVLDAAGARCIGDLPSLRAWLRAEPQPARGKTSFT